MEIAVPTPELAALVVRQHLGWSPVRVDRFTTGAMHFVYEAQAPDHGSVVVRLGRADRVEAMDKGTRLAESLLASGARLPALLGEGQLEGFPYVVMERLAGTDLGHVIRTLSDAQLRAIAGHVAAAQAIAADLDTAGRYGYAPSAAEAPFEGWPDVLQQHFERSQDRMLAAGLFDPAVLEPVAQRLEASRPALAGQPATPFLHDTTTKNVIIDADGRFSGIVDVDDLCFGDPRYAPALTLAVLKGYGGPQSYVAHWMEAAGHADDATFGLYVALFLLDLMAEHGHVFNGNETASTPEARAGLERALDEVLARD